MTQTKLFDLEEERIKQEITRLEAKRVLIQLPEGLKTEGPRIAKIVEKTGALPIVSADPCYGACDLATVEAENLGIDLIIHFGHSKLLKYEKVPTLYVEARATISIAETIEKALPFIEKWRKIGLATTVQHVQTLDEVRELLVRVGKTVVIGDAGGLTYPGQVIGCDYSNAKTIAHDIEAFLFIGGGRFHALGLALSTFKPTVIADPFEKRAYIIKEETQKILKQRWNCIQEAMKARTFAILLGLKPGQMRLNEALDIREKLGKMGKNAYLFAVREITPHMIINFPTVDAYINTACPRIALNSTSNYRRPVLTLKEALVAIGELSWEELCSKGLL